MLSQRAQDGEAHGARLVVEAGAQEPACDVLTRGAPRRLVGEDVVEPLMDPDQDLGIASFSAPWTSAAARRGRSFV